jgi:hypothetical protein
MERAIAEYKSIGFDDNGEIILNEKNKPSIPIAPFAKKWQLGRKAFYERLYEKLPMSAQAGRKPLLTAYEEQVLLKYILLRARMGYGLSSGKLHRYKNSSYFHEFNFHSFFKFDSRISCREGLCFRKILT